MLLARRCVISLHTSSCKSGAMLLPRRATLRQSSRLLGRAAFSVPLPAHSILRAIYPRSVDADEERLSKLLSEIEGKDVNSLISEGSSKLASVPSGGGGGGGGGAAAPAAGGAAAAPAEEEKKEEKKEEEKEESDDDMGFGLFDVSHSYVSANATSYSLFRSKSSRDGSEIHLPRHCFVFLVC